jgi:cytochrome bd ubiquinol oxidase subunit II
VLHRTGEILTRFPRLLPASIDSAFTLTIENAKAPERGLRIGVVWWLIGMALASTYRVYSYRQFSGKLKAPAVEQGY